MDLQDYNDNIQEDYNDYYEAFNDIFQNPQPTFTNIKTIYSLLADEVDDPDYWDCDFANDNDDLVMMIYEYCITYGCDLRRLMIELLPYCIPSEDRYFDSYELYHSLLITAIVKSCDVRDVNENYTYLFYGLNQTVNDAIMENVEDDLYKSVLKGY